MLEYHVHKKGYSAFVVAAEEYRYRWNEYRVKKGVDFLKEKLIELVDKVKEGNKERIQVFEGVVIRVSGGSVAKNFTVRKVSSGIGVERIIPINSPLIEKIEVKRIGKVRRARLYYLRNLSGKAARIKEIRK